MSRTVPCPTHRPATVDMRVRVLRQIDALIAAELHRPLQLDEVARRVHISRRQLQRIYAETTAVTFRSHLRIVRMRRAAELLRTTDLRIVEVAEHGSSPAQYRARAFG
jgi:AraC-like DNA-binding protein